MSKKNINYLKNKLAQLQKEALDKLPDEETQSPLDSMGAGAQDPSMGMPLDPSMMMPPPEPKAKVWDNKYLVQLDETKFIVELTPSIVMDPKTDINQMPQAQSDPMADTTLNPNADPALLQQWLKPSDDNDKQYSSTDQGTVDPLSKQEEGISDTGNEQSVKVHNKKSAFLRALIKTAENEEEVMAQERNAPIKSLDELHSEMNNLPKRPIRMKNVTNTVKQKQLPKAEALLKQADENEAGQNEISPTPQMPGADRSNAYPPCKYCANFNAADNTCSQGLDVEKVQAAKSCSWLNSNLKPFNGVKDPEANHKDEDIFKNDISQVPGGGQNNGQGPNIAVADKKGNKFIKEALGNIWD